jgi:hypothetical protein
MFLRQTINYTSWDNYGTDTYDYTISYDGKKLDQITVHGPGAPATQTTKFIYEHCQ